ncbi:MAG: 4-hydroxy-tetrahydrodipicolinate synthase [Pseudomonadales bacterium]|nr:4-hydroxy-tetrahydrodipicolinate synthase [Pseudomonadales bacterium]
MFCGSLVAIVTPMRGDGSIDFDAWSRLIEFQLANGTTGIVVGGTTGESPTLLDAELRQLTLRALDQARGKAVIVAGAGTNSTASSIERAEWLSDLQVDALLVVTPAYNRPTQEGLFRHYEAVAKAARVPVILYNVPGRTSVDLLPQTVERLSALPRIVALKEAVPDMQRVRQIVAACPAEFAVLSGDDLTAREAIGAGAVGVVSVTANVVPRAMADMVGAARRGDWQAAAEIDRRLNALHHNLFVEANPIPVKWALARMGMIAPGIRLPLTELSASWHSAVSESLAAAGVALNS